MFYDFMANIIQYDLVFFSLFLQYDDPQAHIPYAHFERKESENMIFLLAM